MPYPKYTSEKELTRKSKRAAVDRDYEAARRRARDARAATKKPVKPTAQQQAVGRSEGRLKKAGGGWAQLLRALGVK